jgi:mannosyltransferase
MTNAPSPSARLRAGFFLRPSLRLLVALETVLAASLGLIALGRRSFWLDESVSVTMARLDFGDLLHVLRAREGNMSLYHLLLWAWVRLGDSELVARSLSLLAAAATVPLLYLLLKRLVGEKAALLAGLLLALNPMAIHYAQEARGYALCLFLVTASVCLFARAIEEPRWIFWLGFALVAALAGYAHFFALFVPPALALSILFLPAQAVPWRRGLISAGLFSLLLLPLVYLVGSSQASGVEWASGNLPGRIAARIHDRPLFVVVVLLLGLACVVVAWLGLARALGPRLRSRTTWAVALLILWLLIPFAIVCVLAVVYKPLFVVRYFIVCLPPLVALLALALARIRRPLLALSAVSLVALVSFAGVIRWYQSGQSENWRGAEHYVVESAAPSEGVLFYAPYVRIPFALYLERMGDTGRAPQPVYPGDGWNENEMKFDGDIVMRAGLVRERAASFRRIWLVRSHQELYGASDPGYEATLAGLEAAGLREFGSRSFAGVRVVGYERRSH